MRALLLLLLGFGISFADGSRTWTDIQDRKVDATLVAVKGENVVLRLKDGREVDFPLARLSPDDVEFVRKNSQAGQDDDAPAAEGNFDGPWPERVAFRDDPEIEIVEEDRKADRFVYESANFRYVCDVRLSRSVVRGFALLFEATHRYCLSMPIGFSGGRKIDGKYQILLFDNKEDYVKAGGPPASAGVFVGAKSVIMVPLESLGVRRVGSTYVLDRDKSSKTLPHEITHQLTPQCYYNIGSIGWFIEGIAEYVAVTPYRSGSYNVRGNLRPITDYVTGFSKDYGSGRNLGKKISMPPLEQFLMQDYEAFQKNARLNYGVAPLLVYHFFHFDGEGDAARIKAFLAALHEGKTGQTALALLLDGRSYSELEEEIKKSWGRRGVDFTFGR